jgi:hypothetical protein
LPDGEGEAIVTLEGPAQSRVIPKGEDDELVIPHWHVRRVEDGREFVVEENALLEHLDTPE